MSLSRRLARAEARYPRTSRSVLGLYLATTSNLLGDSRPEARGYLARYPGTVSSTWTVLSGASGPCPIRRPARPDRSSCRGSRSPQRWTRTTGRQSLGRPVPRLPLPSSPSAPPRSTDRPAVRWRCSARAPRTSRQTSAVCCSALADGSAEPSDAEIRHVLMVRSHVSTVVHVLFSSCRPGVAGGGSGRVPRPSACYSALGATVT